jgi:hypothetical protein
MKFFRPATSCAAVLAMACGVLVAIAGLASATTATTATPAANKVAATVGMPDTLAATATTLAVSQSGTAGTDVLLSATVTSSGTLVTDGTVSFYDDGSATPLNPTPITPDASGVATYDIAAGLAPGEHAVVAVFTPTDVTQFEVSQSAAQSFVLQPPLTGACAQGGSQCAATANISATIPVGTLVLTTPYTSGSPLSRGNLSLNTGLSQYSTTIAFNGITVVDTRAGDLPWTLSAIAGNLSDSGTNPGSTICAQNVGLTGVTSAPGIGFAGIVTATDNPAATPPVAPSGGACPGTQGLGGTTPHTVASASAGLGTDVLNATLTLTAPTSTEPGLFTGTITLTVG